ncbi:MAG: class I SAM-dependent methyltransferase [Anaerolineae bacterium]|nr:class I SAM-dependent methyltransferase [Anaerolineae bacterium]
MFHDIPQPILDRMHHLEGVDTQDRQDGTPRLLRLRQIPPQTGRFLALLAAGAPQGAWVEIGASAGYSALWLALACRETGRTLTTFEVLAEKVALARETFRLAEVEDVVTLVAGDAREHLADCRDIAFCFLDAEKEVYADCYELVVPRLVAGGLLVADNAINHQATLQPLLDRALADERVDALIAPIGKGELVCRKRGRPVDKLRAITSGYARRFPEGDEPFQIMTRLLEECGEMAQQVNHFEGSGVKREKHGEPDRTALANEIKQTIVCALRVAQYYGVEKELEDSVAWSYRRLKEEGHIE